MTHMHHVFKYWLVRFFSLYHCIRRFHESHIKDAMMLNFDKQLIHAAPFSSNAGVALQNVS